MQRVKAHELRQRDEKALVDELTKFRVTPTCFLSFLLERIGPIESKQGFRRSSSQTCPHKSKP
jgi:hypothetical protein